MTYIIAEIGCNHNGDVNLAKQMIDEAAKCGVDAVKFQTFKADKLISKHAPKANYQKETTGEQESQLQMTRKLELSHDDYLGLKNYAEGEGLAVFSTPFDDESLDFLIQTDMPIYKISSGDLTNLPFLEKIGGLQKKVILSTGMADLEEIHTAIQVLQENGTSDIALLHCTTEYPTAFPDVNLQVLRTFQTLFPDLEIGYSDHSLGYEVPIAAVAMGAQVIEKHFTLDNDLPGPDHRASATPDILKRLVEGIRHIELALGTGDKKPVAAELANREAARKSIVAKRSIRKGEILTADNLTVKRPGNGISPMKWYEILGKESTRDFAEDDLIELEAAPEVQVNVQ